MAEYTLKQYKDKLDKWAKDFPNDMERALKTAGEFVRGEAVEKHLSGPRMARGRGSKTSATLSRVSGDLANSLATRVVKSGDRLNAEVGTFKFRLKYASQHEYGDKTMPERSYLRSSLKAKKDKILEYLLKMMKKSYENA